MTDYLSIITKLRQSKGWTEYKLAVKSGLPQSTISSWYCKKVTPSVASLDKVCNALGISMSELFYEGKGNLSLTESQRNLLECWAKLSKEQQKSFLNLLESLDTNP